MQFAAPVNFCQAIFVFWIELYLLRVFNISTYLFIDFQRFLKTDEFHIFVEGQITKIIQSYSLNTFLETSSRFKGDELTIILPIQLNFYKYYIYERKMFALLWQIYEI